MAVAMKIRWQLTVWSVMNEESATCTVQELGSWPMTSGHKKAFQALMKVIVAMAAKKFSELGTTIRQYAPVTEPVHARRLLQLLREPQEVLPEQEAGEITGQARDDQAAVGVHPAG